MSEHTQIVRDLYAAFDRRDVGAVLRALDSDIELTQTALLPWGGVYQGPMGAASFFQKLTRAIDAAVTVEDLIDAGETVIVVARTRGRVRSNDARFDIRAVHVWRIRDGKALEIQFYIDTPAMLAALEQAPTGD